MLKNLTISVEVMPGSNINDAVEDAKQLANNLNMAFVEFSFNGVHFSVGPDAKSEEASDKFQEALRSKGSFYKFVIMKD